MTSPTLTVNLSRRQAALVAWLMGEGVRLVAGIRVNTVENTDVVAVGAKTAAAVAAASLLQELPEILNEKDELEAIKKMVHEYESFIEPISQWLDSPLEESSNPPATPKE